MPPADDEILIVDDDPAMVFALKESIEEKSINQETALVAPGMDSSRFKNVRVLVFDLDGTLIDSKLDLVLAVNATLEHMGRSRIPNEDVGKYVGGGAATLIIETPCPALPEITLPALEDDPPMVLFDPP